MIGFDFPVTAGRNPDYDAKNIGLILAPASYIQRRWGRSARLVESKDFVRNQIRLWRSACRRITYIGATNRGL